MKKRIKSLISIGLLFSLLLTGCSSGGKTNTSSDDTSGTKVTEAASGPEAVLKDGKETELRVVFPGGSSSPKDLAAVEEQINSIVSQYMDAKVKLNILEWGVFSDQQNLILSSGEDVALMFTYSSSRTFANNGQVMDITELSNTYAPEAQKSFAKYLDACRIGGKLYGMPTFHEYTKSAGLIARTDILEKLSIDPASIKTWDDVEGVLQKVKQANPSMNLLAPVEVSSGILDYYNEGTFDKLADGVGVYVNSDDARVMNIYDTPEFKNLAQVAYDWNKKGYFMSDAITVTDTRQELLAAGNTFGYIGQIHPGTATQEYKNSGVKVTTISVNDKALTTGNVNFAQYMVPTACSTPEKAVKLLELMLTNKDLNNLLMYGVEGIDYVVKDAAKDIVGYPEGLDVSSVGWNNETWLAGNGSLSHVWESDPPTIWKDYLAFNDSAKVSPLYGFTYDSSNVKTEIAAISNVIDKYEAVICAGFTDPDKSVKQMVDELNSAGMQKIIEDAQKQVDSWRASK